jgi:carbonic anhydrase
MSRIIRAGATRVIQGVLDFQKRVFGAKQALFRELGKGQAPLALFITCSDSRINPNLLTQTEPGELFILRNAGNLVPPHAAGPNGEEATVEYALAHLKVRDIIVCGHSLCGAMHGLLNPQALAELPSVGQWLTHARDILAKVRQASEGRPPAEVLNLAIEQNVLLQVEHLKTYPAVLKAQAEGALRLHAWVYHIETGQVMAHDLSQNRFVPLEQAPRPPWRSEGPAESVPRRELEVSI